MGEGGEEEEEEEEEKPLLAPPSFDCRAVCYPSMGNVRDYFAWRQVDTHINNLYNTAFWALVLKGGLSRQEADAELRVCLSLFFPSSFVGMEAEVWLTINGGGLVGNILSRQERNIILTVRDQLQ